ncbi:hypothetical protein [Edaphobacter albus]|uniref:hypothetical protein n=1 Tax=Edaphobacter sp. 4G125 TaxID=2763071 RepID=UPI00164537AC|nr:hypothetical protein [Edaphobacter sp. 4G125]QNI37415.1 hypothetical protein H7846_03620 [Edaphobacter sp. 4G125]
MTVFVSHPSRCLLLLILLSSLIAHPRRAYSAEIAPKPHDAKETSSLPDSPGAVVAATAYSDSSSSFDGIIPAAQTNANSNLPPARASAKLVAPGQSALPQTAGDKLLLSARESITPGSMLGWAFAAEWSQLLNTPPHYGVNGKAYAQRLGAAAALSSSKKVFGDGFLAIAFHQDPRYYQMGHSHKILDRAIYAATRTVVGRTDSGKAIPNYALILGSGSASALTQAYYPERNVHVRQFATTWGTTLAGSSIGYLVSEFSDDALEWVHLKKRE